MAINADEITFSTPRSVQELGRALQQVLAQAKAGSVEEISSGSGALSQFDDKADIQVVAEGAVLTGMWAVQIYVVDEGATREVTVIALGEGGFARAWGGARNTLSMATSVKKRDQIAAGLR
jgi:hypothetical protein